MQGTRQELWNSSYERRENFLFWPNEEVIRFFAARIAKRTGLHEVTAVHKLDRKPRVLDLGCGIGRHVVFAHQMGCEAYGIDLSDSATRVAKQWAVECGIDPAQIVTGSADALPFEDGYFDFIVSHGVLDSMSFDLAQCVICEAGRVLSPQGWMYLDLISGDDSRFERPFNGEVIVEDAHEKGTIQSYFDALKIERLLSGSLSIASLVHKRRERVPHTHTHTHTQQARHSSRWHLEAISLSAKVPS